MSGEPLDEKTRYRLHEAYVHSKIDERFQEAQLRRLQNGKLVEVVCRGPRGYGIQPRQLEAPGRKPVQRKDRGHARFGKLPKDDAAGGPGGW